MKSSKPLEVERHEKFCHAYLVSFNGRQAAIEAGYKKSAAGNLASVILDRPEVQARLQYLQRKFYKAKKLEREEVLRQLYYLCTRDVLDFAEKDTGTINVDDLRRLPKALRASIDGIRVKQIYDKRGDVIGQEITITLSPKAKAVELAMKHFSLFAPEKLDVKNTVSIDWDQMFKSMKDQTPDVEDQIKELPEKKTELIIRDASGRRIVDLADNNGHTK